MNNNVSLLFQSWCSQDPKCIIQLINRYDEPVGAIYLDKLNVDLDQIIICENQTDEKYYIYFNGIAIFFSKYKKLSSK